MTTSIDSSLANLARPGLQLGEVTRLVTEIEKAQPAHRAVTIGLSGNVTIDLLGTFLRRHAILHGQTARLSAGQFDNHLGNLTRFAAEGVDVAIIVNVFDALMPAFEARLSLLGRETIRALAERVGDELRLALAAAVSIRYVFLPLFHRLTPPTGALFERALDEAIDAFNDVVVTEGARHRNTCLLPSGALAAELGWDKAHDMRSYHRFRAPFSPAYLDRLAGQMFLLTRGFGSYFYKALVVDADNTLWGGVLGEDLASGIALGPHGYPASIYWQVQQELVGLRQRGVLLCLCTKNEPADIDAVFDSHPHMVLQRKDFAATRVNWDDKVANLESIAAELGIGLDSLIFLDDSPFECEAVRGRLPAVKTLQVPDQPSDYPRLIARVKEFFAVSEISRESAGKTEQYRLRALAAGERANFSSQEEYLASLGLAVTLRCDVRDAAPRIAELTQKSNQWNLTTRRYTEHEIRSMMESDDRAVYSIEVADKFGDSGLTGVVIVAYGELGVAAIDTFLLSCRVLGRGIETSFWREILERARARRCSTLTAEYIPTAKNAQVREFWDGLGLELTGHEDNGHRQYRGQLSALRMARPSHIEVRHVI